jgi:biopolymer transport protein ExbD/biopolymer transport protein TolR
MLDITPLIDVVFLLLIFFLLTATFVTTPSIPVELPKASSKITERVRRDLIITVHSTGEIEFKKRLMDMVELRKRLKMAAQESTSVKVLIRADSRAMVGRMAEVMDIAQDVGFKRFGLATRPRD